VSQTQLVMRQFEEYKGRFRTLRAEGLGVRGMSQSENDQRWEMPYRSMMTRQANSRQKREGRRRRGA